VQRDRPEGTFRILANDPKNSLCLLMQKQMSYTNYYTNLIFKLNVLVYSILGLLFPQAGSVAVARHPSFGNLNSTVMMKKLSKGL